MKETRTKSEGTGGLDAWTRALRRRTHPSAKGKHKSRSESCGRKGESCERKGEKGWAGPPSPTQGRDPGSDPQGPRPRAGAASSRRARPRHRARVPGSGRVSLDRARLHVPAGPRAGEAVRISSACGSVPAAVLASCRRAGVGKAPRTHQVQSRGTHRVRPGAHSELPRHSQLLREPERARSPGDPPRLRYGRPSPLKKGDQVRSKKKKKSPPRFFKEKQNPSESQSCSLLPPDPLLGSSDSTFPAGRRINTQTTTLSRARAPDRIHMSTHWLPAVQSPTLGSRPQPRTLLCPHLSPRQCPGAEGLRWQLRPG